MPPSRPLEASLESEHEGTLKASLGRSFGRSSSSFLGEGAPILTWEGAAAIITTFCTSSSTSLLPFSFGRLGWAGAPVVMLAYMGLALFVQLKLAEIAASNPHVYNVADIGQLLGGRWGRNILSHCCLWNQQFFMPVAIVLTSRTLQFITWGWFYNTDRAAGTPYYESCNGAWIVGIFVVFIIGVNLMRNFGAAAWLSKVSLVTNTLQVFFILMNLARWNDDPKFLPASNGTYAFPPLPGDWNLELPLVEDASNPIMLPPRENWGFLFLAVTNIGYSYCPCFITIEVMSEMENRHEMAKALKFSTIFLIILYLTVGIGCDCLIGWRMDYSMVQGNLVWGAWGIAANMALCYACVVDYLIAAVTVNKWVQLKMNPSFKDNDWSRKACFQWFTYTMPSTILCLAMCLLIPKLETLCGILTSVIIPVCQIICPACLLLRGDRYGVTTAVLQTRERILLLCAIAYGVMLLIVGTLSTAYSIGLTINLLEKSTGYFCNDLG